MTAGNALQYFLSIDNVILESQENIARCGNNFSGRRENFEVDQKYWGPEIPRSGKSEPTESGENATISNIGFEIIVNTSEP